MYLYCRTISPRFYCVLALLMVKKINAIERVPVIRRGICSFAFNITSRLAKIIHMYMLTISRFFCIVLLKGGNVYVT